jgi:hypothetical protein
MNLADLKDKLQAALKQVYEKIIESSLFIKAKDSYSNFTPAVQKLIQIAAFALVAIFLFYSPINELSTSAENLDQFSQYRKLTKELFQISRDASSTVSNIPIPPDSQSLMARVKSELDQARLNPDQIKSILQASVDKGLPEHLNQGAVDVQLANLNLKQIVDIGYKLQNMNPSIKMQNVFIEANAKDPRYYDVTFKMAILKIPAFEPPPLEVEEPKKGGKKPTAPKKNNESDEG